MSASSTSSLYEILVKITGHRSGVDFYTGWKQIFPSVDNNDVLRQIGLIYQLTDSAKQEIESIASKVSARSTNHWRTQILAALTNPGTHWEGFRKAFDDHTLSYLELQATLIEGKLSDSPISIEILTEALDNLREAIRLLVESEIPREQKIQLVRQLRELVAAIEDYEFVGNPGVFSKFKATTFDLAAVKTIDKNFPKIDELEKGLSIIANAIAISSSLKGLAKPALKLLGIEA
ncbi:MULTISPECIES: hypothetical protein [Xanthomonas]|uniref:hypothetical protein n=1 Tax=Xanthomonas TaxID=338 RepID=UPI000368FD22|nr:MULTISPECIES: hypothetical protein [Xanthomonas]KEZ97087.1 hypothetical protein A11M_0112225 [Xanthomonas vasicola pv. vasculorum NCPPB 895]KFA36134.1 hypothetical protein KWI_0110755 [Xanthomonas vasicola pv. vasculorum NCPPB 206]MBV6809657.1 hypothetical protein [Xanthomonas campestris pv. pennamericanum]MBV7303312.1 hypothetical protein [Xanthomonas vasicola pv. vasculorum]MDO6932834.1 hypothetical protein [Xanthomonas vasicola]